MATGSLARNRLSEQLGVRASQALAWRYYGTPESTQAKTGDRAQALKPIGEVRYIIGWHGDQMSRMRWRVKIDGSYSWRLTLPSGVTVVSDADEENTDDPRHPARASETLLNEVRWGPSTVRQVTTNLFVAGEMHYVINEDDEWEVVSVIHGDRQRLLDQAKFLVRGLWPHPADPDKPDAPLFGVLGVCEELDWLSKLASSQSANRVGMRGVFGISDQLEVANGGGHSFYDDFHDALSKPMDDPTDMSPVLLRGPQETVSSTGQGGGMNGLSWLVPDFPYDDKIDARIEKCLQRLAYGLPVPPEVLLGMQAQSRATAFQVEENSYRAHIEPAAHMVAWVAKQALDLIVPQAGDIDVEPDPSEILARRHSTQDAFDAFDRGAIGFSYLRETLGIPESAAATDEDIEWMRRIRGEVVQVEEDPGNEAAAPVLAAVGGPEDTPLTDPELSELSDKLADIDYTLMAELAGATQQATDRVREKIGSAVRSNQQARSEVPSDIPRSQVGTYVGLAKLKSYGVKVDKITGDAVEGLLDWWGHRVEQAFSDVRDLLGESAPEFSSDAVERSKASLASLMDEHVAVTLGSPAAHPLPAPARIRVISIAGGA